MASGMVLAAGSAPRVASLRATSRCVASSESNVRDRPRAGAGSGVASSLTRRDRSTVCERTADLTSESTTAGVAPEDSDPSGSVEVVLSTPCVCSSHSRRPRAISAAL